MDSVRNLVCVSIHPGQVIETHFRLTNMYLSTRMKMLNFLKVVECLLLTTVQSVLPWYNRAHIFQVLHG